LSLRSGPNCAMLPDDHRARIVGRTLCREGPEGPVSQPVQPAPRSCPEIALAILKDVGGKIVTQTRVAIQFLRTIALDAEQTGRCADPHVPIPVLPATNCVVQ